MRRDISVEAKHDKKLRDDYERWFYSVFSERMKLEKILEGNEPTPDFKVVLNGKEFKTEVKGLDPIYEYTADIFRKICKELKRENLIKNFALEVTPFNIHIIEDKEKIEKELKRIIPDLDSSKNNFCFCLKTDRTTYSFKLKKGNGSASGTYDDKEVSNLIKDMRRNRQYEKIDFLTLINLNQEIDENRLIEEILNPCLWFLLGKENKISTITIFKDNIFSKYKNLKFVLILDPVSYISHIICSPYQVNKFGLPEMYNLVSILKDAGFNVKLNTIKLEWVEYVSDK